MHSSVIEFLTAALQEKDWGHKFGIYSECVDDFQRLQTVEDPKLSVVIISWKYKSRLLNCLKILEKQRGYGHETIFVDNGAGAEAFSEIMPYVDTLISLNHNTGAYLSRNVGALFSRAPILLFLDDDALPEEDFILQCLRAFELHDIISLRGAVLPNTLNPLNFLAPHYFFGNEPLVMPSNLEGVTAYKADVFFKIGGWDDDIVFGHGGIELSYRITQAYPDLRKQIYYPGMVIYHDYVDSLDLLAEKDQKQATSKKRLEEKQPDINNFISQMILLQNQRHPLDASIESRKTWRDPLPERRRAFNADFYEILGSRGMHDKYGMYEHAVCSHHEVRHVNDPMVSVIVQCDSFCEEIRESMQHIRNEKKVTAQIIIVQDGPVEEPNVELQEVADHFVHLRAGLTAATAKNIGSLFAESPILLFLDHKAIVSPGILEAYCKAFIAYEPFAIRGACAVLDKNNPYNKRSEHFYLGGDVIPRYGDLPENTAYLSEAFYAVKGFFDPLPDLEGIEISSRLSYLSNHAFIQQLYSPHPLIHMDAARTKDEYEQQRQDSANAWKLLQARRPMCLKYMQVYKEAEKSGLFRPLPRPKNMVMHAAFGAKSFTRAETHADSGPDRRD